MLQFGRTGAEPAALQHHIRFRRIGYDHHQQLLVNVNSCYILRHILTFPAREARSARARQIRTVPCFDLPEPGRYEHTYPLQRAFRIRLAYGLDCSKAVSTSFAPAPVEIMPHLEKIFITSNVPQGHQGLLTRAAPIPASMLAIAYRAATVRSGRPSAFFRNLLVFKIVGAATCAGSVCAA